MEIITTFGQWVKVRRKSLDLTQEQLALLVGCSPVTIKKIESNERRPSRQIAQLLAERLQLSGDQQEAFVRSARGDLSLERLPLPKLGAFSTRQVSAGPGGDLANTQMSIPHPVTPLIGRNRELAEVLRLLQAPQCRLLTLTGIGGTGKTRLAVEAALQLSPLFADGAFFISLAGVELPSLIVSTVASELGITFFGPMEPKRQLFHYLNRRHTLLVLDNLEHLLEGADLFNEMMQYGPDLKLLATSREQLHLEAEWVFEVRGLPIPENARAEEIESSSASRLFIQRAQQAQSDFQIKDEDYAAIARICRLVQGLPLAIELAARWTRALSCEEIAQEIERGLEFLASNSRSAPPRDASSRHRSLQAVFDHSWHLLSGDERFVSKQLSIFRGGFSRDAAEQVAGASLPVLSSLIDKSLLWRNESHRYGLHELVRQYLAAKLGEIEAEKRAVFGQHSRYYLNLLQKSEPALRSRRQRAALKDLEVDIDNIRLAWNTAVENGYFDLLNASAVPLYTCFEIQQYFAEAEGLFRQAADSLRRRLESGRLSSSRAAVSREDAVSGEDYASQEERVRLEYILANFINFQAFFAMRQGNYREALALFETSISLLPSPSLGNSPSEQADFPLAFALLHEGVVYWSQGSFEQAARRIAEGLPVTGSLPETWLRGLGFGFYGGVLHDQGDHAVALNHLQQAIATLTAADDPYLIMFIGTYYSRTLMTLNRLEEAQAFLQEGLRGVQETGNRWLSALGLEYLARAARLSGDTGEVGRLLEESVHLHREVGDPWSLTLSLLEMSRYKLQCADFAGAEQHTLEAIKMSDATGSAPIALEGLGILAAICVEQGLTAESLCLVQYILQHPSTKQDTREQAQALQARIHPLIPAGEQGSVEVTVHLTSCDSLLRKRFGVDLPSVLY